MTAPAQDSARVDSQPNTKSRKVSPQNRPKFTKAQVAKALLQARGVLSDAAELLATSYRTTCSRQTLYNALDRWPDLRDLRHDVAEEIRDMAEGKLFDAIRDGEPWAVRYFLSKRAADRGYGKTAHIEHGGAIEKAVTQVHILDPANLVGKSPAELVELYRVACQHPSTEAR
jgi:hypothetical protein